MGWRERAQKRRNRDCFAVVGALLVVGAPLTVYELHVKTGLSSARLYAATSRLVAQSQVRRRAGDDGTIRYHLIMEGK